MNDGLKQRIVGALVLVALGIIFIPVIFDKERIVPVDRTTQIPAQPDLVMLPLPDPPVAPNPVDIEIAQPISGSFQAESTDEHDSEVNDDSAHDQATIHTDSSVVRDKNSDLATAWVLRVASFKAEDRAKRLRDELIDLGYKSYINSVDTSSGRRTRLYVGPTIDKISLGKAKSVIDKKYNVASIYLKFKP